MIRISTAIFLRLRADTIARKSDSNAVILWAVNLYVFSCPTFDANIAEMIFTLVDAFTI